MIIQGHGRIEALDDPLFSGSACHSITFRTGLQILSPRISRFPRAFLVEISSIIPSEVRIASFSFFPFPWRVFHRLSIGSVYSGHISHVTFGVRLKKRGLPLRVVYDDHKSKFGKAATGEFGTYHVTVTFSVFAASAMRSC